MILHVLIADSIAFSKSRIAGIIDSHFGFHIGTTMPKTKYKFYILLNFYAEKLILNLLLDHQTFLGSSLSSTDESVSFVLFYKWL